MPIYLIEMLDKKIGLGNTELSTSLQKYNPELQKAGLGRQVAGVTSGILGCRVGGWYAVTAVTESQQSNPVLPMWFCTTNKGAACLSTKGFSTYLAVNLEQK